MIQTTGKKLLKPRLRPEQHYHSCIIFGEYPEEEVTLLDRLMLEDAYFFGAQPSHGLPMRGILLRGKEAMFSAVRESGIRMGSKQEKHSIRVGEGGIIHRR